MKKITLACFLLFCITAIAQTAKVGELRDGGVVFWVDPSDNNHGLVCALSDYASELVWGCTNIDLPNVPNVSLGFADGLGAEIGDGANNTKHILIGCSHTAAGAARSIGPDWFLPSAKELNEMWVNKATLEAVPGFSAFNDFYWSSTEIESEWAWGQYFIDAMIIGNLFVLAGQQGVDVKAALHRVRAVRAF